MYAHVRVVIDRIENTIVVPEGALLVRNERPLIFLVRGGKSHWQYVEIGERGGRMVEVLEGAAPGDTVIIEGHYALAHDTPVVALSVDSQ
jgi:multidrug efflux pump subunit AcrA (membrane-fusion protein)